MRFWGLALLTVVALAGCSEPTAVDDAGDHHADDHTDDHDDAHGDDHGDGNVSSLPRFTAAIAVPSNLTAGAAFNVTLSADLDANASSNATWILQVVETPVNGTGNTTAPIFETSGAGLPADAVLNLTAGNFTLQLNVSAAGYHAALADVAVAVQATSAEPAPVITQEAQGGWTVGAVSCPHTLVGVFEDLTVDDLADGAGILWDIFAVDAATIGQEWTFTSSADSSVIVELDFFAIDGTYMEYHAGDPGETLTGTVPVGAGHGVVFPCGAGPGTFSYATA